MLLLLPFLSHMTCTHYIVVGYCYRLLCIAWSVCLSVCVLVTIVNHAKMAELIKLPFGLLADVNAKNRGGTYGHHLMANKTERSMCGASVGCGYHCCRILLCLFILCS